MHQCFPPANVLFFTRGPEQSESRSSSLNLSAIGKLSRRPGSLPLFDLSGRDTYGQTKAPRNKSKTRGEDGCNFTACSSKASSQCCPVVYPREFSCCAAPLRAWDGYPGKPFHRPPGQTCLESADWDTVDPGSRAGAVLWVSGCGRLSTQTCRQMQCQATGSYQISQADAMKFSFGLWVSTKSCGDYYNCVVFVTVLVPTGSGSARSDGLRASRACHHCHP